MAATSAETTTTKKFTVEEAKNHLNSIVEKHAFAIFEADKTKDEKLIADFEKETIAFVQNELKMEIPGYTYKANLGFNVHWSKIEEKAIHYEFGEFAK